MCITISSKLIMEIAMKTEIVLVSKDVVVNNRYVRVKLTCKINHIENDTVYLVTQGGELKRAGDTYNDVISHYNNIV